MPRLQVKRTWEVVLNEDEWNVLTALIRAVGNKSYTDNCRDGLQEPWKNAKDLACDVEDLMPPRDFDAE